jgi:hypothetical protein
MLSANNGIAKGKPSSSGSSHPASGCFLRLTAPPVFAAVASQYGRLLDRAVEQCDYENGPPISAELREFAVRLGQLGAGARDVIELHSHVLDSKLASLPRARGYVEEGRLLVLELMGHLLSYYRTECMRAGSGPQRNGNPDAFSAEKANRGSAYE